MIHGSDMATAVGWPAKIDRHHASLIFVGFLLPVFRMLPPAALVNHDGGGGGGGGGGGKATRVQACFEIRLRGAARFRLVSDRGR